MTVTRERVASVLQVALLGEVSPALRGVGFGVEDDRTRVVFFYDGPISEEDEESASCVVTELIAALPEDTVIAEQVVRLDAPARLPDLDAWAYRRRET